MPKKTSRSQAKPTPRNTTTPARSDAAGRASTTPTTGAPPAGHRDVSAAHVEAIAVRAYQIYLERGSCHGRDLEDWLQAEHELRGRSQLAS